MLFKSDRINTSRDDDGFAIAGYRMMAARMLSLTLSDMLSEEKHISQAAKDWFDPVRGKNSRITLDDCVYMIGRASHVEAVRNIAFSQDTDKINGYIETLGTNSGKKNSSDTEKQQRVAPEVFVELQLAMR